MKKRLSSGEKVFPQERVINTVDDSEMILFVKGVSFE